MAQDSGTWTPSTLPKQYQDPTLVNIAATATNTSTVISVSTGSTAHNLVVGQSVIMYGFSNAWLNYAPNTTVNGVSTLLGAGKPAVVASVTSSTAFTVNGSFSTTASGITGYIQNDSLVTNQGWDNPTTWLTPVAQTNVQVAREWGNTNPIQPNKDATDGDIRIVAVAASAVSGNGAQVTFTVGSGHGLVAGQAVTIQGVVPASYNFDTVQIASTGSTSIKFNSTVTDAVTSATNALIVPQLLLGGTKQATINAATGATQQATVTPTPSVAGAKGDTTITVATTSVVVGAAVSGTGIASGTVVTGIGTGTITINPPASGVVASSLALTIGGNRNITYQTVFPHNLAGGQYVNVTGASNANYNAASAPVTVLNSTTFSVPAPALTITAIATASGQVTITTAVPHGVTTSDYINVAGVTGGTVTAINVTSTQPSAVTATTITYTASSPVLSGTQTSLGTVVKSSGTFGTGTAYVGGADNGWAYTYNYPSAYLNPVLDNHDRVTNSDSGYPAYTPTYTAPTITGLTTTNAIQKIRAAGMQPGQVTFSSDLTVTAAAQSGTGWVYTTGSVAHTLSVGDTVNLSGGGSGATANNLGDVTVAAVSGFTFTIANTVGTTGVTTLVARPKNTIVTAQSINSGSATSVNFVRNFGLS